MILRTCLGFLALCTVAQAAEPGPRPPLVIAGVTVIDGTGAAAQADRTVVVEDGRITAIGPTGAVAEPTGATRIDGRGKYLIPGLWDMHVHLGDPSCLPLFVANGVTGVRVMWGSPSFGLPMGPYHQRWRRKVESGRLLGPRLVIASNMLDGPKPVWPGAVRVADAEQGRRAVDDARQAGADFIKVYSMLPRAAYFGIAAESRAQGLSFAGHLPFSITVAEASDAGQRSLEHLIGLLVACSDREAELVAERAAAVQGTGKFRSLSALLRAQRPIVESTYDEARARALFDRLARNGTFITPTLTVLRVIERRDDPALRADPRLKYMTTFIKQFWNSKLPAGGRRQLADFGTINDELLRTVRLIAPIQQAGVPILAGTDQMNPFCFPGFSLHDELAYLVDAGLTPMQAIQAATLNPSRFFGLEKTLGTIEAGKDADLVLLDADPLADIHNTTSIRAVVSRGRLLDRDQLDQVLAEAESAAAGAGKPEYPIAGGMLPPDCCLDH